jgi:transposase-like protein
MSGKVLNEKGQCPVCLIKPLVYKGRIAPRQKFCHRCNRSYDLDTGKQRTNWAFTKDDELVVLNLP